MKDGFLNLLKPPGMSSHDMVNAVRRRLGVKKVGHAGTLDPGAAGVLPIAVGRATKFLEYLSDHSKAYRAELIFGYSTDSGDDTGRVLERQEEFVMPSMDDIERVLESFRGDIVQIPPKFSAIKIDGKKAYDMARNNQEVSMPERHVLITRLDLVSVRNGQLLIDVDCSKGTYIRSLCVDIGRAFGILSTMGFLLRKRVGEFLLEDSVTSEEFNEYGEQTLIDPGRCLSGLRRYQLPIHRKNAFCNGLATTVREKDLPLRFCVYCEDEFIGIGGYNEEECAVVPVKVY